MKYFWTGLLLIITQTPILFAQLPHSKQKTLTPREHIHGPVCLMGEPRPTLKIPAPAKLRNPSGEPLTFQVEYDENTPLAAQNAFEQVAGILSNLFSSPVPIKILVSWENNIGNGTIAYATPGTYLRDFQDAPKRNTWYPIALARKIGRRAFGTLAEYDILVTVNGGVKWHFTGADIQNDEFDFVTVMLHEVLHGMGFAGFANVNNGQGTLLLENLPVAYNSFLENGNRENLLNSFDNGSTTLGQQLQSNDLFLSTSNFQNLERPKIFAPSAFAAGSSISHLDLSTFDGTADALMIHRIHQGAIIHNPGIVTDILYDMGWSMTNIYHEPGTGEEDFTQPWPVVATIRSDAGIQESTLQLHYSQDTFKTKNIITMSPTGKEGEYQAIIPAPGQKTSYQYYISVLDNRQVSFLSPAEAPNPLYYEFFYEQDNTLPEIVHEPMTTIDDKTTQIAVEASVTDYFTGVDSVWAEYRINGGALQYTTMDKDFTDGFRPDLYTGFLNIVENLQENDLFEYRIKAIDRSPNQNEIVNPVAGFHPITVTKTLAPVNTYVNDFAVDENDFNGNGFSIEQPAGFRDPAIHSIHPYTNAGSNNTRNFNCNLRLPVIIRSEEALIEFDEIVLVEPGEANTQYTDTEFWDYVIVEGKKSNSNEWLPFLPGYDSRSNNAWLSRYNSSISQQNSTATGNSNLFRPRVIDMLENGNFAAGDTVLVRFRLFSDPFAVGWGWAIDNLHIQDNAVSTSTDNGAENSAPEMTVFPNPLAGNMITLKTENFAGSDGGLLRLTDLQGRTLSLYRPALNQNTSLILPNLPAGVYFVQLFYKNKMIISQKIIKKAAK